MNRRDAALIAHLDAIDARWTTLFGMYHSEVLSRFAEISNRFNHVDEQLQRIREDIAGVKLDAATHRHDDD